MHLGDVRDGRLFCTSGLESRILDADGGICSRGRFPDPKSVTERAQFRAMNSGVGKSVLERLTGRVQTTNIWAASDDVVLANVGARVYRSTDGGRSWSLVLRLTDSSPPKGVLPTSFCAYRERLYLAEYPLGGEPAKIYVSDDGGRNWETLLERDDVRHFHGVYRDPFTDELWANTGDRDGESSIGRIVDGAYEPIGRGGQRWRGVELAFTPEAILWGKDASFAAEKPIYRLSRDALSDPNPEPDVVGTTESVLFYAKSVRFDGDHWVVASTTSQTGIDSTAPPDERRNTCPREMRILAASSRDEYESWHRLATLERRRAIGNDVERVPTTDAHAFIHVDDELGLFVNPYNTSSYGGRILRTSMSDVVDAVEGDELPTFRRVA